MVSEDDELRRRLRVLARAMELQQARWEALLPDLRVLLLLALQDAGREDLLTGDDRALLDSNAEEIGVLRREIAAVDDVVRSLQEDGRDFDEIWDRHFETSRRDEDRPPVRKTSRSRSSRWLWRVPVAIALVGFAFLAVMLLQRDAGLESVATAAGETRIIEFADGSTIRLLENSRLDYVPDERQSVVNRKAVLHGRALFDVAPQRQGMIIETPGAMMTVIGTIFGVIGVEESTEVTLVDGRLALAGLRQKDAAVVLEPGQQSRVEGMARPSSPSEVDLDAALDWTGLFIFRAAPLKTIAERLSRHFDITIDVDPSLADERLTGTFEQDEPALSILMTLAAAIDARVDESPSRLRIIPR